MTPNTASPATLVRLIEWRLARCALIAVSGLSVASVAHTAPIAFTDPASFLAALTGLTTVVNFDTSPAETPIPEGVPFGGVSITTNLPTPGLIVSDHFDTSSPLNYLGVDDGFSNEFLSGHELTIAFTHPVIGFGLYIIASGDDVLDADFLLAASGGSVFNAGPPLEIFGDGGELFFLGIVDPVGFVQASLISFGDPADPAFAFNLDDLTTSAVPEPASLVLLGPSLIWLGRRVARASRQSAR